MNDIVKGMIETAGNSLDNLRARISEVKYAPVKDGRNFISFKLDGRLVHGELKGRNRHLVLGAGLEQDRAIAVRCLLDEGIE